MFIDGTSPLRALVFICSIPWLFTPLAKQEIETNKIKKNPACLIFLQNDM
jgi:hypothetical protein